MELFDFLGAEQSLTSHDPPVRPRLIASLKDRQVSELRCPVIFWAFHFPLFRKVYLLPHPAYGRRIQYIKLAWRALHYLPKAY